MSPTPPGGFLLPIGEAPWALKDRYPLRRGTTALGRDPTCDVRVLDDGVSRRHAELRWSGDELVLIPKSETNSTYLNDMPVSGITVVNSGDTIELAEGVSVRVELFTKGGRGTTRTRTDTTRRLLSIMCADVAEFARIIGHDERDTVHRLEACRGIFREDIVHSGGRVVDMAGDSVLAVYGSVFKALASAANIQSNLKEFNSDVPPERQLNFRIGINVGDVIVKPGGRIYGDPVNIAARLQAEANPGEVLFTGAVFEQIAGNAEIKHEFLGRRSLKNIVMPVRVYRLES